MLVLMRKESTSIDFGDFLRVTVQKIDFTKGRVYLQIFVPAEFCRQVVLSLSESYVINNLLELRPDKQILIQVVELHQRRIKLGIEAPESVPVLRTELLDRAEGR